MFFRDKKPMEENENGNGLHVVKKLKTDSSLEQQVPDKARMHPSDKNLDDISKEELYITIIELCNKQPSRSLIYNDETISQAKKIIIQRHQQKNKKPQNLYEFLHEKSLNQDGQVNVMHVLRQLIDDFKKEEKNESELLSEIIKICRSDKLRNVKLQVFLLKTLCEYLGIAEKDILILAGKKLKDQVYPGQTIEADAVSVSPMLELIEKALLPTNHASPAEPPSSPRPK